MPSPMLSQANMMASVGKSGRGSAGVYELQLQRKLLQQQLGVVDDECKRVGKVVAKKHLAKLRRKEYSGGGHAATATAAAARGGRHRDRADHAGGHQEDRRGGGHPAVAHNSGDGLPAIGVVGTGGGGGGVAEQDAANTTSLRVVRRTKQERTAAAQQQQRGPHLLTAEPFKKGGCIDHTNKRRMLQDKQKELEREKAAERNARPARRPVNVRDEVTAAPSIFPDRYLRGEVPCSKHCSIANALVWVCPLEQLDYDYYLPMFFDGIRCLEDPCMTLARQGVSDLLSGAIGSPERILPSLPAIMRAIRVAISCKNPGVILFACSALRQLATGNKEVGEALVAYYKMFLHVFNLFMNSTKSTGDKIDYGQRNTQDIGEAVSETVEQLERHGGKKAFAHIKHCIPTYQSCVA